jgi:hypothetical protein
MSVVQASKGVLKPVSKDLLSETIIVCRLAKATLDNRSKIDWINMRNTTIIFARILNAPSTALKTITSA